MSQTCNRVFDENRVMTKTKLIGNWPLLILT